MSMIGTDCAGAILVCGEKKTTVGPEGPARIFDDVRRAKAPGPLDGPDFLHRLCRNPRPMQAHRSPVCSSSDEGLRSHAIGSYHRHLVSVAVPACHQLLEGALQLILDGLGLLENLPCLQEIQHAEPVDRGAQENVGRMQLHLQRDG